jgi:hypothetical protein
MAKVYDGASSPVKLAPSDLTFLWECPRCLWLKAKGVLKRPSPPMPKIFTRLDHQAKDFYFGKPMGEIPASLPPGRIAFGDRWVRSRPLDVPGHTTPVVISGRIDTAISFDDGSFGIIDFKTSEPKDDHVPFYGRQLHAYALAAENPAPGALRLAPVTRLGLLCIEPTALVGTNDGLAYEATAQFLEIPRDDEAFLAFVSQVLFLLERPEPPEPGRDCAYCSYLALGSLLLVTGLYGD